jgi:hypothetical protein
VTGAGRQLGAQHSHPLEGGSLTYPVHTVVDAPLTPDRGATDGHRGGLSCPTVDRPLQEPENL